MMKLVVLAVLSSLWLVAPLRAQTTCVDDFENQTITDAGPEPFFTNGKCGDTYHRGFVSTSDAAHGKVFVGGSLFCPSGSPCSPTTDIFLPGPATNVSFDLQSGFQTLVQTDGFSRLFPSPFSPATQFQWLHVVIPSTGSHITLTTSGFPSTHVIDNFTFTLAPPPPPPPPSKFIFDLDDHYPGQKLLLHRYDEHDLSGPFNNGYFSNYQVTTVPLDQAPQFRFPGAVTVNGVATAQSVYVRVIDPPDTAAYVPHPTADDNIDPHRKKGTLFYYDSSGNRVSATPGGMLTMTANSDNVPGRANIFLEASDHVAGENYQLEASFDQNFPCATAGAGGTDTCAKSVIVTTWKRLYVEEHAMFRSGTFLSAGANAGETSFAIQDPVPFQNAVAGTELELIHADSGNGEGFYWDFVPFQSVQRQPDGHWIIRLSPGATIPRDYGTAVAGNGPSTAPWGALLRDAVGIPAAGTYFSGATFVGAVFADAFVDVQPVSVVVAEAPHIETLRSDWAAFFGARWLEHKTIAPPQQPRTVHNLINRIAANQANPVQKNGGWGVELGFTPENSNASFLLDGRIDQLVVAPAVAPDHHTLMGREFQGKNPALVNARTTAHETVHFWVHAQRCLGGGSACQPTSSAAFTDDRGHCLNDVQYDNSAFTCLLHQPAGANNLDSANVHMHYRIVNGSPDSEYLVIRTAAEPGR